MLPDSTEIAKRPATGRSAVSNGTRVLPGVDGRSAGARRYRDLLSAFSDGIGEPLSAIADQIVRRLAQVSVELETLEAASVAGTAIDAVAFCTLVNVQRRLVKDLDALKRQQRAQPKPRALQEYIASRAKPAEEAPKALSEAT